MNMTSKMTFLAPVLAFIIYGGWSAFVNSEHGNLVALKAGLGQGIYALFSTWVVTLVTQKVFITFASGLLAYVFGFSAGFAVMVAIPITIHTVLATPDILEAITPGLIWGSGYLIFVLRIAHKQQTAEVLSAS